MRYIDSGQRDPSQSLGAWMKKLDAATVAELRLQTGFFGITGIAWLMPVLDQLRFRRGLARCLIGSNSLGTSGKDVQELVDALGLPRDGARLAVCAFANAFFHPKVVHIRRIDGSQNAYVGSANLTESGVGGLNVEAGVLLDTNHGDPPDELKTIAAAVDAWFDSDRHGCLSVTCREDVNRLVEQGVLSDIATSNENSTPPNKQSNGGGPTLPMLSPLLRLPTRNPRKARKPRAFSGVLKRDEPSEGQPESRYFMMELSKNRISGNSYQADIGKLAFTDFFGGKPGGRIDIHVSNTTPDGKIEPQKKRQLVDVKSKNYRLEIAFPFRYPSTGRPIVTFRKRRKGFGCLLLMPEDVGYAEARTTLIDYAGLVAPGRMHKAILTGAQLEATWPKCPLL